MTHPRMAQIEAIQEQNKQEREWRAFKADIIHKEETAAITRNFTAIANAKTESDAVEHVEDYITYSNRFTGRSEIVSAESIYAYVSKAIKNQQSKEYAIYEAMHANCESLGVQITI